MKNSVTMNNNLTTDDIAKANPKVDFVLVDADYFVFRASSAVQKDICWGDNLWTCHADEVEAIIQFKNEIEKHVLPLSDELDAQIVMCFSDPNHNFRKDLNPEYKSNRSGNRKPVCYRGVVEWVMNNYIHDIHNKLEADDTIGILATENPNGCIISSPDKDFYTIPDAYFYRVTTGKISYSTQEDAEYAHMLQTLTGDVADGYKGCPKMGAVKAKKYLDEAKKDKGHSLWYHVVQAYEGCGSNYEEALMNARMAKILTVKEYNLYSDEISLWKPPAL